MNNRCLIYSFTSIKAASNIPAFQDPFNPLAQDEHEGRKDSNGVVAEDVKGQRFVSCPYRCPFHFVFF